MLVVHHLGISQSERVVWLCEELEIPYQLIRYERDPATRFAPANYKALHPIGTAPVITDGGRVLAESGAIMEYIIFKYGSGRLAVPADKPNYADYLFWFHFANASMMPALMTDMLVRILGGEENDVIRAFRARSQKGFDMIEQRLGAAQYFAGNEFTAADIMMFFPLTTMRAFMPRDFAPFPNLRAYLKRVGVRPAYQRAMNKADPNLPRPLE